jgi:IclR family transcriptional regulator, pca regulon regulatory protein
VTPRVLRLGSGYLGRESLAARAQPTLDAISERLGEHIAIGVIDGDEVITLAAANSPQSRFLAVAVQVGQRLPATKTSLGRVLLAHRAGADDADGRRVRADGYVVTDGLLETGLRSLAVPIRDHTGEVVASLSVAVNAVRVPISQLEQDFLPVMQDGAATIGTLI